jgi:hypothetical protein
LTERLAHRDPTAGGQRRAETLRAPAVVVVNSGSCRRHAMFAGEHLISYSKQTTYVNIHTCSWRRQRQRMQGRGQGLQRHRCPMLLLIARAGHDAPSVVNRTAAGEGVASETQQGCWQGSSPSRYVMPSVPQPACSLTSTRQRLPSSASHSTLIGGAPSCSGMAVFDRHTSMGASVLVPLIEPGPSRRPAHCSPLAQQVSLWLPAHRLPLRERDSG